MLDTEPDTPQKIWIDKAWSKLVKGERKIANFQRALAMIDDCHSCFPPDAQYDEWQEGDIKWYGMRNKEGKAHGVCRRVRIEASGDFAKGMVTEGTYRNGSSHGIGGRCMVL